MLICKEHIAGGHFLFRMLSNRYLLYFGKTRYEEDEMVKKERLVSISGLAKTVLKRWRFMLLIAFLFAILLGGYRGMKLRPRLSVKEEQVSAVEAVQQENASIDLNAELDNIERAIVEKNNYFLNSFFAQMNSVETPYATMTMTVNIPKPEGSGELTLGYDQTNALVLWDTSIQDGYRILNYYLRAAESNIDWTPFTEKYHTKAQYFNELLKIKRTYPNLPSYELMLLFPTEEGAKELMDHVVDSLTQLHDEVADLYGEHELVITNRYTATNGVDKGFNNWMNDRLAEINNLCTQRDNLKNNMRLVNTASTSSVSALSKTAFVKSCCIFAVLGFLVGILLFALVYSIYLILANRVLSARELNRQYDLVKLAAVPVYLKDRKGIDACVQRIDRGYYSSDTVDTALEVAGENIRNAVPAGAKVALVGDLQDGLCEQTKKLLEQVKGNASEIQYISLPNLNKDPAALANLEQCEAVVLLARANVSSYVAITDLLGTVLAYEKKVIGSIVFD